MGFKINMNWIGREFEWIWGELRVVVNMIKIPCMKFSKN